jgi:hypothetical protein
MPPWLRRTAVAALAVLAVGLFGRSGLLSAGQPAPARAPRVEAPPPAVPTPADAVPHMVARDGARLVRYTASGASVVARLPAELRSSVPLVAVDTGGDGAGAVLGVAAGRLFRVELGAAGRIARLGPAQQVFGAPHRPGEAFVVTARGAGARVVAVDADSGTVREPVPFPGFRGPAGWTPRGSLFALDTVGLLVSRPAAAGEEYLAVAWIRSEVAAGLAPRLQTLGSFGRLLGTTGDWVLVLERACPGHLCRVKIISLTRDKVLMRDVHPPPGWSFAVGSSGQQAYGAVVPVVLLADPRINALARLVPGGRNALLIEGSEGVDVDAGVIEQPDEDVYFAKLEGPDHLRVARWRPLQPGVTTLAELPPLPRDARLVCVCG